MVFLNCNIIYHYRHHDQSTFFVFSLKTTMKVAGFCCQASTPGKPGQMCFKSVAKETGFKQIKLIWNCPYLVLNIS